MADWLVVGLGNPGSRYEGTFHNLGADAVALLVERHGGSLRRSKDEALVDTIRIGDASVVAAFPQTFMNESGRAVARLWRRDGLGDPSRLVVVHDELDLEPGRLRVKVGGGLAGHNGLRSISQHLGTQDFLRVRIGVGKPPSKERGAGHVLGRIPKALREEMAIVVAEAADAVETIVSSGPERAQNLHNR